MHMPAHVVLHDDLRRSDAAVREMQEVLIGDLVGPWIWDQRCLRVGPVGIWCFCLSVYQAFSDLSIFPTQQ